MELESESVPEEQRTMPTCASLHAQMATWCSNGGRSGTSTGRTIQICSGHGVFNTYRSALILLCLMQSLEYLFPNQLRYLGICSPAARWS